LACRECDNYDNAKIDLNHRTSALHISADRGERRHVGNQMMNGLEAAVLETAFMTGL